jgi:hypothetical protein
VELVNKASIAEESVKRNAMAMVDSRKSVTPSDGSIGGPGMALTTP